MVARFARKTNSPTRSLSPRVVAIITAGGRIKKGHRQTVIGRKAARPVWNNGPEFYIRFAPCAGHTIMETLKFNQESNVIAAVGATILPALCLTLNQPAPLDRRCNKALE